ncbi:AAA family ATPase [Streptomyces chrestomyceticus]|uniref:AAA family ATPase n=1 Tax=Streptomyces chrestomyceticus TaxID=68185 RepID=UPI0033F0414E
MTPPPAIRIAVMGAHSTGKTTLLHRIEQQLHDRGIPVQRSRHLARRAANVPLPKMQHQTVASTQWAIATGIADEVAAAAQLGDGGRGVVLVSQACWQALAYFRAAQEWNNRTIPRTDREALHRLASAHTPYDLLLATHLDPGIPVKLNHDHNPRFRTMVDRHIHALLAEEGLPHVHVTSDRTSRELAIERALQLCPTQAPV